MLGALDEAKGLLETLDASGLTRSDDPLAHVVATEMALRAMQLMAADRLRSVREQFAATNQALIFEPEPQIVPERDALIDETDALRPIDLVDLISDEELVCVSARLHRGWQDRVQSCRQARRISHQAVGFALIEEDRDALLGALATCNRVFRVPPPVELNLEQARAGLFPVLRLMERLAPASEVAYFQDLTTKLV